jgi:hypothetical protein
MENEEKILPIFTMVGFKFDNSSGLDLIDDPQLINAYFLLNPNRELTISDIRRLREIKEVLPYEDGDFKRFEVLPYRDHEVDYTKLVFDLASVLEEEIVISPDGETVLMSMWNARVIAQAGVLFGIIPEEIPPLPGIPTMEILSQRPERKRDEHTEDYMDSSYTMIFVNPAQHDPDLPINPRNGTEHNKTSQNGYSKERPQYIRARIDRKTVNDMM